MTFAGSVFKHTNRRAQAWRRTSLSIAVGLMLSSVAMAQSSEGTLYGQAKASSTVTVTSLETGSTRQVQTDASGKFSLPKLQPGRYSVASGGEKQEVTVSIGSGTQVMLGGTTLQQVQVTGSRTRSAIDVASVESNTLFTQEQLQSLPVPRNVNAVALLAPGVVKGDALNDKRVARLLPGGHDLQCAHTVPADLGQQIEGFGGAGLEALCQSFQNGLAVGQQVGEIIAYGFALMRLIAGLKRQRQRQGTSVGRIKPGLCVGQCVASGATRP